MTRHFCMCLSLKVGAVIMSFLNLLEGAIEIIVALIELTNLDETDMFANLKKHVNIVPKICNATKFCNETILEKQFPTGQPGIEGNITLFTVCLILGFISLCNGVLLLMGMIQAKEKYILWYVLTGSVGIFIVTIYSGMYMFNNGALLLVFLVSIFMIYGQIAMYYFYEEVAEYNTVKAGVIEISYSGDAKSYTNSGIQEDDPNIDTAV